MQANDRVLDRVSLVHNLNPNNKIRLNDENMTDALNIKKGNRAICIFDSQVVSQALNHNNQGMRQFYRDKIYQELCRLGRSPLVLMPLFHDEHWSLAALITLQPNRGCFALHFDSSGETNTECFLSLLAMLRGLGPAAPDWLPYVLPKRVPQQKGTWQCGHFVLMNADMMMSYLESNRATFNADTLDSHLRREIMSSSDRNIRAFTRDITALLL